MRTFNYNYLAAADSPLPTTGEKAFMFSWNRRRRCTSRVPEFLMKVRKFHLYVRNVYTQSQVLNHSKKWSLTGWQGIFTDERPSLRDVCWILTGEEETTDGRSWSHLRKCTEPFRPYSRKIVGDRAITVAFRLSLLTAVFTAAVFTRNVKGTGLIRERIITAD